ncbi:MAG: aminodeoxychorismate/anthranilate synthase component II [Actinomycetota bacterium]|jgi:anthranilate synthase/aminodeoxychorismate synthase-like glutamine amidotransferase
MSRVLVIDNYDSFTWNLVQEMGELGAELEVRRNNQITLAEIEEMSPDGIVISPGPGRPEHAGLSIDIIRHFGPRTPLLGVCLGHQAIGALFGASIVRAPTMMHGKVSPVEHHGTGVFSGLESPLIATRYHSLVIDPATLPVELEVTAWTDDIIMGVRHRSWPLEGVQFHPESVLTTTGPAMLANFLRRLG